MLHRIVTAKARPDFKLRVEYEVGESGGIDFRPVIEREGKFAKLADPCVFTEVRIG